MKNVLPRAVAAFSFSFAFAKATISHVDASGNVGNGRASRCLHYASEISHIESRSSYDRSAWIRFLAMLMTYIKSWNSHTRMIDLCELEIRMRRSSIPRSTHLRYMYLTLPCKFSLRAKAEWRD